MDKQTIMGKANKQTLNIIPAGQFFTWVIVCLFALLQSCQDTTPVVPDFTVNSQKAKVEKASLGPPEIEQTEQFVTVNLGEAVEFVDVSTGVEDGVSREWDFGDGNTQSTKSEDVYHAFGSEGFFKVELCLEEIACIQKYILVKGTSDIYVDGANSEIKNEKDLEPESTTETPALLADNSEKKSAEVPTEPSKRKVQQNENQTVRKQEKSEVIKPAKIQERNSVAQQEKDRKERERIAEEQRLEEQARLERERLQKLEAEKERERLEREKREKENAKQERIQEKPATKTKAPEFGKTGVPYEARSPACISYCKGGTLVLRPKKDCELLTAVIRSTMPGKMKVTITGSGLNESMTLRLVNGRTQFSFQELYPVLSAGNSYTLSITPLRDNAGKTPEFEEISKCISSESSIQDKNIPIDYKGSFFLYDLSYKY